MRYYTFRVCCTYSNTGYYQIKVQFKCIDYVQRMLIEYWLTVSGTPAVAVTYRL